MRYDLIGTDIISFEYRNSLNLAAHHILPDDVKFDFKVERFVNLEEDIMLITLEVIARSETTGAKDQRKGYAEARIKLSHEFFVENLKSFCAHNRDRLAVEPQLDIHLTGITYSTSRGYFMRFFAGTVFEDEPFPILDPSTL